jgi:uncharacterized protein YgiM (DUF1202 family)
MLNRPFLILIIGLSLSSSSIAQAGDCTGIVIGVRPINLYNHVRGNGYLAVRSGPGSSYQQIGEVYLDDEISVWDRRGDWYAITCMSGRCEQPYWGNPVPSGWAYGRYLSFGGDCP